MREFIISTESNCDLPKDYIAKNNICVIPHYYTVDDQVYGDDKELTCRQFYDEMRNLKKVGTMASNPAVIEERFTAIAKEGKDILHISFSSALSGGCGNVVMTSKEVMEAFPEMTVTVVDTLSASLGEALLIMKAVEMKKEGKSLEETARAVEEMVPHLCILFTVDDLNYLYRGGRLSKTSTIMGTLASIKPILRINEEGKLVALSKVRGRNKSLHSMAELMGTMLGAYRDRQMFIGIVHGDCEEDAQYLQNIIKEKYGYTDFYIQPVGPSIGAHSGPGTVGLIFLGEQR